MQLKRLEAYGFKSFADRTVLEFPAGITAIVGPNGSGKSNITDAVRWVLGEQNVRNLRGVKSEDILFSGSASRRPLGAAEVSLTFDNSDHTLPIAYGEVTVTRRLYRSGESEYLLNRSRCRLKDILTLFADTGIGHDGMSIIGQNRIDDILNSRPEERRAFFEETAGITKFRSRKKETERRLESTHANYVRISDILQEIGTQLEPLREQAEKTQRFRELTAKYDAYALTRLARDYAREEEAWKESGKRREALQAEAAAAEAAVSVQAAKKEAIEKEIVQIEQEAAKQAEANEELHRQNEDAARELTAIAERRDLREEQQKRLTLRQQTLTKTLTQAVTELARLADAASVSKKAVKEAEAILADGEEQAKSLEQDAEKQNKELTRFDDEQRERTSSMGAMREKLAVLARDLEAGSADTEERETRERTAKDRLASYEKALADENRTAAENQRQMAAQEEKRRQASAERQEASNRGQKLAQSLNHARSAENAAAQKLRLLRHMQEAYEGFGRANRAVLQSREPFSDGVEGAVAELLSIPPQYVTAMEAALGSAMQNIVTRDTATAKGAIAFLKRERLGRVTFLPRTTIVTRDHPRVNWRQETGAIGWADDLVDVSPEYRNVAAFLLARTLVADTLDHALAIAARYQQKLRIVTLTGEILNPGGSLTGGGKQHRDVSFLNRRSEIETLQTEQEKHHAEIARLETELAACNRERGEREQEENAALQELQDMRVSEARDAVRRRQLQEQIAAAKADLTSLREEADRRQQTFREQQEQRKALLQKLHAAEDESAASEQERAVKSRQLADLQQSIRELDAKLGRQRIDLAVRQEEAKRQTELLNLRRAEKARSEEQAREQEDESKRLQKESVRDDERQDELQRVITKNESILANGQEIHDRLQTHRLTKLAESRTCDQEMQKENRRARDLQERYHGFAVEAAKREVQVKSLAEQILQQYGLTPQRAQEEALDVSDTAVSRELRTLKGQIDALGPVNPQAVEEYEKLRERHDFLEKQSADLVQARDNLMKIIGEMDEAMTKQFREAFRAVQGYFQDTFARLFGGGEAELRLTDPQDILHAGVDILVTLPAKKRQNLSALSGGERALTVIALLFALFRYRPSPFSVLDEIDAALDEANVTRFGRFLQEFAGRTQFIVVTHRKGTMAAADTMYGVTIASAGVSKIISVRLDTEK